ncbi:MAG: threonine/serine exporter family protein [Phocaeicola sp.]|uniref:threonine/serine exporter family protein n=1 Tax=Phocaeicola sp. TaxID=2773926 RepID=UPI0023D341A3|nr:threonine/serine exporter family protein [Phocaeicola sp.]MDE5677598.1 threonine/serine exporter family protein [Phocaeicola sp.]MDE6181529.1 threonine/serine exporter family protein [Phocaeicola sp.]
MIDFFQDALFASIAAIGFASISNPPHKAYSYCAVIAAVGHSVRFLLMLPEVAGTHIVIATAIASFVIGTIAVLFSTRAKMPAETFLFPSLLPMIPGIYAYKTFGGLVLCLYGSDEPEFMHSFYLFANNGLTCLFILLGMVIGANSPIFLLKRISFRATRGSFHGNL